MVDRDIAATRPRKRRGSFVAFSSFNFPFLPGVIEGRVCMLTPGGLARQVSVEMESKLPDDLVSSLVTCSGEALPVNSLGLALTQESSR